MAWYLEQVTTDGFEDCGEFETQTEAIQAAKSFGFGSYRLDVDPDATTAECVHLSVHHDGRVFIGEHGMELREVT